MDKIPCMLKTAEINTQAITIEINLCFFTNRVNPAILRLLNSYDFTGRLFHASIIRSEKKHDPLEIFKILFQKNSSPHRSTSCVQILWNLAAGRSVKSRVAYLTEKKTKFRLARSLALASAGIASKIYQGQRQTMYSECPKLHPNRFTSAEL